MINWRESYIMFGDEKMTLKERAFMALETTLSVRTSLLSMYISYLRSRNGIGAYSRFTEGLVHLMHQMGGVVEDLCNDIEAAGTKEPVVNSHDMQLRLEDEVVNVKVVSKVALSVVVLNGKQDAAIAYIRNNAPSVIAMLKNWKDSNNDELTRRLEVLTHFLQSLHIALV